ncbi:MAG: PIG-L family deacetylase [Bryobacteraceae bacterium]
MLIALALASVRPTRAADAAELKQQLEKLSVLGSTLMIAAHPDDENTALLAYFARGRKMRTGYLSATRGEGGQNLIGSEQGEWLGLIRTQELLAARRIDGAEQYFTGAIDFGFSKTLEETLAKWGRERTLGDMVRVIRQVRPDVIILRFSGTPRDGHGHHQTSAILGKEAFLAAADRARFPEQGLEPWKAKRLLFNVFAFTRDQEKEAAATPGRLEIDTGEYNPVLGRSYNQIAGLSRSQHRSQGMGSPERVGPSKNYLVLVAGDPAEKDPFDGVDTTWGRVPGGDAVAPILTEAARTFSLDDPSKTIPHLLKARPLIRAIRHRWAGQKLRELDEAIASCAGLWIDAAADRHSAPDGTPVNVTLTAVIRSRFPMAWKGVGPLTYNQPRTRPVAVKEWTHTSATFDFEFEAGGETLELRRSAAYRYVDPVEGEKTRPVVVVPPVSVNLSESVFVFPARTARRVRMQVQAHKANASGEAWLDLSPGWTANPARQPFAIREAGAIATLSFEVLPPEQPGHATLRAVAAIDGQQVRKGVHVISYPHIPAITVFPPSEARLERVDVKNLARKAGYIAGAGDEAPRSIRQLGCEVTLLSPDDLAGRDLNEFDAIVTGVRAYNVRPDLRANQDRLLEYVRNGGTLIVQYNVAEGGPLGRDTGALARLGPYPLKIGRDRVTVEDSPVRILNPKHPLMTTPNEIGPADFEGWVQERGLYFPSEADPRYEAIIETNDPGEKPLAGGLLYARYGKGVYIFTAYSWFRQLPAGVPGAYRIFANLLSANGAGR